MATVAVLYPGAMGHAIGRVLSECGHRVVTCLAGRSPASAQRAAAAGLQVLPTLTEVVREAEVVLSILPPAAAVSLAEEVARCLREAGRKILYADCNAIAPATMGRVAELVEATGSDVVDAAIFGPPPGVGGTRINACGAKAAWLVELFGEALPVTLLGPVLGRASALKMCYAALTKGSWTLHTALLTAAQALGVREELLTELAGGRAHELAEMQRLQPRVPRDAGRWVGEMEEVAATFAAAGVTPRFHEAARDVFAWLDGAAATPGTDAEALRAALDIYAARLPMPESD